MIDLEFVQKLLDLLNSSNVGAIEVRKNLWSTTIRVSKTPGFGDSVPVTYQVNAGAPAAAPRLETPEGREAGGRARDGREDRPSSDRSGGGSVAAPAAPAANLIEIKSPMVGTFYAQPEPGAEPYVRVGSRITPGQTLCIIEAMKIMNPIDAEVAGVVREICVQDAQPVEYGHVLFRVDPNG
jgi:acetyl-CoA carboxylase biotin carboxyl carrier protein